jgi:hypothetical protein
MHVLVRHKVADFANGSRSMTRIYRRGKRPD